MYTHGKITDHYSDCIVLKVEDVNFNAMDAMGVNTVTNSVAAGAAGLRLLAGHGSTRIFGGQYGSTSWSARAYGIYRESGVTDIELYGPRLAGSTAAKNF